MWPVTNQPPSVRSARVVSEARSEPASGSLNNWHQSSSAPRMGGSHRALLLVGAVGEQGGPDEVDADAAHQLGRPGPGHLLGDQEVLGGPEAPAAELDGPGHPHPPVGGQGGLPLPAEGHHLGQVGRAGRRLGSVLPGQVGPASRATRLWSCRCSGVICRSIPAQLGTGSRRAPSEPGPRVDGLTLSFAAVDFDLSTEQRTCATRPSTCSSGWPPPSASGLRRAGPSSDGARPAAAPVRRSPIPPATTGRCGRRWPGRGGWAWPGARRSGASGWGWSRWRCCARSWAGGWPRRPSPAPWCAWPPSTGPPADEAGLPEGAVWPPAGRRDRRAVRPSAVWRGRRPAAWRPSPTVTGGRLTGCPEPTLYASVADLAVVVTGDAVYVVPSTRGPAPRRSRPWTAPGRWPGCASTGHPPIRIGGDRRRAARSTGRPPPVGAEMLGAPSRRSR